jgi:hypothetical protein
MQLLPNILDELGPGRSRRLLAFIIPRRGLGFSVEKMAEEALTCALGSIMNESRQSADLIGRLRAAGASGVDDYSFKLKTNEKNDEIFRDLLFEGKAALMFLNHHWQVELRDRPDLKLQFAGELLYAEVKHFRLKEQDQKDEDAMLAATDELVRYGDLGKAEGSEAWEQVVTVARNKVGQYVEGAPNILVVESSTVSLELMASSAVHAIDEACGSGDLGLCRLSGLVLVDASGWKSLQRDVEFCKTSHAAIPLSENLCRALEEIQSETRFA